MKTVKLTLPRLAYKVDVEINAITERMGEIIDMLVEHGVKLTDEVMGRAAKVARDYTACEVYYNRDLCLDGIIDGSNESALVVLLSAHGDDIGASLRDTIKAGKKGLELMNICYNFGQNKGCEIYSEKMTEGVYLVMSMEF